MAAGEQTPKDLLQTPNPTELKTAAQKDPIVEREAMPEAEVAVNDPEDADRNQTDKEFGRESAIEISHSHVTTTNLSGH